LEKSVNADDLVKGFRFSHLLQKEKLNFIGRAFVEDIALYQCGFYLKQGEESFLKFGQVLEKDRPKTEGWRIFYSAYQRFCKSNPLCKHYFLAR
jgi:hypothetical protein